MRHESFWHCIQAVASALGAAKEETLADFESELKMMGPNRRGELRQDFRDIIAGLTLLEMRMATETY